MAQNTGTLISAAIRPNDSLDPIASAFATEIKGGLHTAANSTDRDNIIFERREWGMMCYVTNQNKTYQLKYNYTSTSIMDNNNWVEFSGSGGSGGGSEWIDSVISISNTPPVSPSNGDRYILGPLPAGSWGSLTASLVLTYNSTLSGWDQTVPTNGTSVIVDDEYNAIYTYQGNFPSGVWTKENINQLRAISATTLDGYNYTATSLPTFTSYAEDSIFLVKFNQANTGFTVSLDVNGLGAVDLRKPGSSGISQLELMDIQPDIVYNLTFDGTFFQINRPYVNDNLFNVKYFIEPTDYIVVPPNYQYLIYSDLQISGTLVNYGQVIIANGSMILSGGTFSNFGSLYMLNFTGSHSFNDGYTIQFTQSTTFYGLSVSAEVKNNSLTQSKLSIVNSGSEGYVLSYTASGDFIWTIPGSSTPKYERKYSLTTSGDDQPTGFTLSNSPNQFSRIQVFVNGFAQFIGDGTSSNVDCYFSNGSGPIALSNLVLGDELYWNSSVSGYDLSTTDIIFVVYET